MSDDAPLTPPRRQPRAPTSAASRSAVANGKRLIADVDTHSREYREYKDVCADLVSHLGGEATAVERHIIEEIAGLVILCRGERAKLLQGEPVNVAEYNTSCNTLNRLLKSIGLQRRAKDITDTVESLSAEWAAKDEPAGGESENLATPRADEG